MHRADCPLQSALLFPTCADACIHAPCVTGWGGAGPQAQRLRSRVRVTTRAMWVDKGRLLQELHKVRTCQCPLSDGKQKVVVV